MINLDYIMMILVQYNNPSGTVMIIMRQWMDIQHRPQDDFMQVTGFTLAVRDVLRLRPGGLLWAGHPCGPSLCCKGIRDAVCEKKKGSYQLMDSCVGFNYYFSS